MFLLELTPKSTTEAGLEPFLYRGAAIAAGVTFVTRIVAKDVVETAVYFRELYRDLRKNF